jgi:hypothetical protein
MGSNWPFVNNANTRAFQACRAIQSICKISGLLLIQRGLSHLRHLHRISVDDRRLWHVDVWLLGQFWPGLQGLLRHYVEARTFIGQSPRPGLVDPELARSLGLRAHWGIWANRFGQFYRNIVFVFLWPVFRVLPLVHAWGLSLALDFGVAQRLRESCPMDSGCLIENIYLLVVAEVRRLDNARRCDVKTVVGAIVIVDVAVRLGRVIFICQNFVWGFFDEVHSVVDRVVDGNLWDVALGVEIVTHVLIFGIDRLFIH